MKNWPKLLLNVRARLSPRNKSWEPYSSFIRKHVKGMTYPITCLEIGGFNGSLAALLIKSRVVQGDFFVNVDLSAGGLADCKRRTSIECVRADASSLPFRNGLFDFVYSVSMLEHVNKLAEAVSEQCRVARGMVIFQVPNINYYVEIHSLILLPMIIPKSVKARIVQGQGQSFINFEATFPNLIRLFLMKEWLTIDVFKVWHSVMLRFLLIPSGYMAALVPEKAILD